MAQLPTNLHPILMQNQSHDMIDTQGSFIIDYRKITEKEPQQK